MIAEPTTRKIKTLITDILEGRLNPRPAYQRRLVWLRHHKVALIDTILKGFPFPEIYLADGELHIDTAKSTQEVVDGQQRLNAIVEYFNGDLEIKASDDIVKYSELEKAEKEAFLNYSVSVRDLSKATIEDVKDIFKRINKTSYNLNGIEVNNSVYTGEYITNAINLTEDAFFEKHNVFTGSAVRRMKDVEFVLLVQTSYLEGYFNRNKPVDEYLERYNEEFPMRDDVTSRITAIFSLLSETELGSKSPIFKRVNLLPTLVELDRFKTKENTDIAPDALRSLASFFAEAEDVSSKDELTDNLSSQATRYASLSRSGTNDRTNRIERGKIVHHILEQFNQPSLELRRA